MLLDGCGLKPTKNVSEETGVKVEKLNNTTLSLMFTNVSLLMPTIWLFSKST